MICPLYLFFNSIQVRSGPGLQDKESGVKLGGQKPAADQHTQGNYSIVKFYLVHKETKKAFFPPQFVSSASPPLLIRVA